MRKGKLAAQVAHASMAFITRHLSRLHLEHLSPEHYFFQISLTEVERAWLNDSFTKVVVSVDSCEELQGLISRGKEAGIQVQEIIDSGRTEFHGVPTLTCAAFGPDTPEKLDPITGNLPLI